MESGTLVAKPFRLSGVLFDELRTPSERLVAATVYDNVREDDIVVCTYPKAGSHWVADIASKIISSGGVEGISQAHLDATYLEMSPEPATFDSPRQRDAAALNSPTLDEVSQYPSPRILLTHLPGHLLPPKIRQGKAKLIYLHRDPRDMAVSLWHSMRDDRDSVIGQAELSWAKVFECFLDGNVAYGSWADHFKSCQELTKVRSVLVLHYENLLKDLNGAVKQIAAYIGKELSDSAANEIAESCTLTASKHAKPKLPCIRKGVAGEWQSTFTVAQCEIFDVKLDAESERLNLDVPYWPHSKITVKGGLMPGLYKYQGVVFFEKPVPFTRLSGCRDYSDIRDDDVFVWTYPKAGTHWAADIALKLMVDGNLDKVTSGAIEVVGLEINTHPSFNGPFKHPHSLAALSQLASPRVIMTHLRHRMLPELVQQGKGRLIYIFRDPRDMAVSMYCMLSRIVNSPSFTWERFLASFKDGQVPWGSWWEHFKDCQHLGHRPNLLVLNYEDMKQDLLGNVQKVADFLGKSLSKEIIQKIADSCSIEAAKAERPKSLFIRKGTTGDWKNFFTVDQIAQFDEQLGELKQSLGLDVPY